MPGLNYPAPIMPVTLYDSLEQDKKQLEYAVPVATGANFPAATIVSVNASGQAQNYDPAVHNVALSHEATHELVTVEQGPWLYKTGGKSNVYLVLIEGKRLVFTASWTGTTPVIYDPGTHLGQQFELAIDPVSGYTFIDLTTAGTGPFKIVGLYEAPGLPEPTNTALPDERRQNARVIVEVDPTAVFIP